jgi:hypothetical protein
MRRIEEIMRIAGARNFYRAGAATLALTALALALPAGAAPQQPAEYASSREAGEPIMAIVSIQGQRVTFYDAEGWIVRAPVSTGTKDRETPAGIFAVIEKDKDHYSSLYDDAWMPNMQRVTWNGLALHGGPLPGYAASHGCVRMPYEVAEKLFSKTRIGMRVIISPLDVEPVEFSHPSLFVPKQELIAAVPARAEALARQADEATKAAAAAKKAILTTQRDAATAQGTKRQYEYQLKTAEGALAYAEKAVTNAKTDEARAKAEDLKTKAAAKLEELRAKLEAATANAKTKQDAALTAKAALKTTEAERAEAVKAAKDAKLALSPVSVFISRATKKIYVRRPTRDRAPDGGEMFDTVLEAPVTIRDADKPIGTHVFTAVANVQGGLRWTEVTIDNGDNAKSALERITFPQEVLDRIAPTTMPRSSITISDEPLSRETNYRTEFVVVLNNHPQGGFANRARTVSRDDDFFGRDYSYGRSRYPRYYGGGFFPFFGGRF